MFYLDLQEQSGEAGDEVREVWIRHTLLSVLHRDALLHHLLGVLFASPPQLRGMVSRNHALIGSKLETRTQRNKSENHERSPMLSHTDVFNIYELTSQQNC